MLSGSTIQWRICVDDVMVSSNDYITHLTSHCSFAVYITWSIIKWQCYSHVYQQREIFHHWKKTTCQIFPRYKRENK